MHIIIAAWYAKTLLFLLVTPSTKSTDFGRRYHVEAFTERNEIWQLDRGGLAIYHHPDW